MTVLAYALGLAGFVCVLVGAIRNEPEDALVGMGCFALAMLAALCAE